MIILGINGLLCLPAHQLSYRLLVPRNKQMQASSKWPFTYHSLDHLHSLVPELGKDTGDVHVPLSLRLLEGNVYRYERTCATHTSAVGLYMCVCECVGGYKYENSRVHASNKDYYLTDNLFLLLLDYYCVKYFTFFSHHFFFREAAS